MALFNSGSAGATQPGPTSQKGEPMGLKEYDVEVNGHPTTLQLSDEDAKLAGLTKKDLTSARAEAAADAAAAAEKEAAARAAAEKEAKALEAKRAAEAKAAAEAKNKEQQAPANKGGKAPTAKQAEVAAGALGANSGDDGTGAAEGTQA